jgi:hypothetical protein
MATVQIAQQDATRITSRGAGAMSAADDALLSHAARSMRIRGRESHCETTATFKLRKSSLAVDPSATAVVSPQSPALSNLRTLSGDWRASL